jgi:hypothetical protein
MTGLSGAMAGVLLWFAIFGLGFNSPGQNLRFALHPVEFHSATDKIAWNHQDVILPGQTLHKTVKQGSANSFHFRLKSVGPVDLVIKHETPQKDANSSHNFALHGVRYASLRTPQEKDVIVIRNEGDHPVELNAFAEKDDSFDNQSTPNKIES